MMRLLGNRVLLRPLPRAKQSAGGVIYSEGYRDDRKQYIVMGVGPGRRLRSGLILPPEVRPGDKCLCNPDVPGTWQKWGSGWICTDASNIAMIWK